MASYSPYYGDPGGERGSPISELLPGCHWVTETPPLYEECPSSVGDFATSCLRIAEAELNMASSSLLTDPLSDAFDSYDFGELSVEWVYADAQNMRPLDLCSEHNNAGQYDAGIAIPGTLSFISSSAEVPDPLATSFAEPSVITVDAIPFYCENAVDQWPASLQGYLPPLQEVTSAQQLNGMAIGANGNAWHKSLPVSDCTPGYLSEECVGLAQETWRSSGHKRPRLVSQRSSCATTRLTSAANDTRKLGDGWMELSDAQYLSPPVQQPHYQALAMSGWVPDTHLLQQQVPPTYPDLTSRFRPPPGPLAPRIQAHADPMPLEVEPILNFELFIS